MASTIVAKNMGVSHFHSGKNIYDVLSVEDLQVEKKVSFSEQVLANCEGEIGFIPTKTWDGPSRASEIYSGLLYDFMNAPQTTSIKDRQLVMLSVIMKVPEPLRDSLMRDFIEEAELTAEKLSSPEVKKTPLWSKGSSGKKSSYSFQASQAEVSLQWINLFIKSLNKIG